MITRWSHGWYLRFYWNLKKILSRQFQLYPSYGSKFITLWILQKIDQNFLLSEPSKILESNNLPKKKNYFSTPCSLPPKSAIFIISFHWKCLVFELKFVKNEKKKKKTFLGCLDSFFGSSETHISGSVFETPIDTVYLIC